MTGAADSALVHGSAVGVEGRGVLILGRSGSGKSGLALQLMALGARLVADDQVRLDLRAGHVEMSAPRALAGRIEARNVGLLRVPATTAALVLAVDLELSSEARLPRREKFTALGREVDLIRGRGVPNLGSIVTVLLQTGRLDP